MYNLAKKYLLLGLSLSLLIAVTFFFFEQEKETAIQTETASKKQAKLSHIKYEGAVFVSQEEDNIDDKLVKLDEIETAGTFNLTSMVQEITTEALKAFSDTTEHALPLLSHWNVGIPEFTDAMNPMYMIGRIEQGEHILVSWKLDPYYANTIGNSYYEESIKKAAELQLPLVFIVPAPESALTQDSYYKNLPKGDNPNVVDENNNTLDKLSPFGPDERWNEVGNQWSTTTLMTQLQEWYPNPPLVIFVSEDEAAKLSWNEVSISSRYLEYYDVGNTDDNFTRVLVGGKWIEKYRQMQNGFKEGFTEPAWKNNVKFISYNKLSDNFGKSSDWIDSATVTNQYVNLWPLTTDGTTIDFDLTGTKTDTIVNSPHVLANNLPFMLKEAKNKNPNFAYQLNIDDNSKIADTARYRGLTQFALWFLRPNIIRQKSSATTRAELEPMFQELADSVKLIHYNPEIAEFWKNGELVSNGDSYLNNNIPEQYQDDPRWFLLDADVNPARPWLDSTNIKVWSFALVKGEAPNREWLLYVQSPEGDISNVSISIFNGENILINSSKDGSFYSLSENNTPLEIISKTEEEPIDKNITYPSAIEPTGTKYYFDATNGNDTNDGLTEMTAKQTLAEIEAMSFLPGDGILFKRGETFRGKLYLYNYSGTTDSPIIFGAYGDGEKPIITSVKEYSMSFQNMGNSIWKASQAVKVGRLLENGAELVRSSYESTLNADGVWYYNTATQELSIVSDTDPSSNTYSFSAHTDTMYIYLTHDFVIQDLDIRGGTSNGLVFLGAQNGIIQNTLIGNMSYKGVSIGAWGATNSLNLTFNYCIIDSAYPEALTGNVDASETSRGVFDGFVTFQNAENIILSNSIVKDWHHTGLAISGLKNKIFNNDISGAKLSYGAGITTHYFSRENEIYDNLIHDLHERQQLWGQGNYVHHNTIRDIKTTTLKGYNTGQGIWLQGSGGIVANNRYEYNTIENTDGACIGMYRDTYEVYNNSFTGNIMSNCGRTDNAISIHVYDDPSFHSNTFEDNTISSTNTNTIKYRGVLMSIPSFNINETHNDITTLNILR